MILIFGFLVSSHFGLIFFSRQNTTQVHQHQQTTCTFCNQRTLQFELEDRETCSANIFFPFNGVLSCQKPLVVFKGPIQRARTANREP